MSTALVSSFYNLDDVLLQNRKVVTGRSHMAGGDKRLYGSPITGGQRLKTPCMTQPTMSPPLSGKMSPPDVAAQLISALPQDSTGLLCSLARDLTTQVAAHRKLDRSISEPTPDKNAQKNINSSRYKTELCRPFEENGFCKYGDKCQFAHGHHELRSLARHPKYKTELCRTFHTVGFCPYGPRCHFIHNEDERKLSQIIQQKQQQAQQQAAQQVVQAAQQQALQQAVGQTRQVPVSAPTPLPSQRNPVTSRSLSFNLNLPINRDTLGSTADSPPSSVTDSPPTMSPTFPLSTEELFNGLPSAFTPPPASAPAAPVSSAFTFPDMATLQQSQASTLQNHSLMTPLNIHTEPSALTLASSLNNIHLAQQTVNNTALLTQRNNNLNNLLNDTYARDSNASMMTDPAFVAPPSPPESLNGDAPATPPTPTSQTAGSPVDLCRSLRLPIFSKIASD